jgi:hypothetical protein
MIIHSDSTLGALVTLVVLFGAVGMVSASAVLLASGKFRRAAGVFLAGAALLASYTLAVIAVSLLTPQKIVNAGNDYCVDNWCIGIDRVVSKPLGQQTAYQVGAHIFSDANRMTTSAKGSAIYLMDERGRRFPLVNDPTAVPYDVTLKPHGYLSTTLSFVAPADSRHLFLTGGAVKGPRVWVRLYLGSDDSLLHKPTLLRVM